MVNVGYENCVEFCEKGRNSFRESTKPLESLDYLSLYPVYPVSINIIYFGAYQIGIRAVDLGAMAARNSGQRLDGMAALSREMKEIFISFNKKLDLLFKMQEEALMKKMVHKSVSVTKAGLAGGGNESDLNGIAEDEPNLVDDEEIKMSLSDSYEVGPELLGDEEITPDLTSTDGFKVELTSSTLVDEVVSETRVFGAAKNHQLGAITNHGWTIDQISKILTEQGAAKSPSSASTKKKKKKKMTSFVKDRGKTPTLQRRGRRPRKIKGKVRQKAYQNPSQVRSSASASASASEKKTKAAATFVKDPRVPTSLSSASAKKKKRKKKKKEKETKFVKDRGKSTTGKRWRTQWHIDGGA